MSESPRAIPPVTEALRAEAASRPGAWVYSIDPFFDPADAVPPYGIIGAWKVDSSGRLTREFKHNPNYRPSPRALGMAEPTDAVDAAIQLAATGYADDAKVRSALLESTVFQTWPPSIEQPRSRGTRFVTVYTSERQAPSSAAQLRRIAFRSLLTELPDDVTLKLNPESRVSAKIPLTDIAR